MTVGSHSPRKDIRSVMEHITNYPGKRQTYDEFIANLDYEFGRLLDYLEEIGLLGSSYLILTSDHGELFERGHRGHNTPLLFEPLLRVPLVISSPGQEERKDIHRTNQQRGPASHTSSYRRSFPFRDQSRTDPAIPGWERRSWTEYLGTGKPGTIQPLGPMHETHVGPD